MKSSKSSSKLKLQVIKCERLVKQTPDNCDRYACSWYILCYW